MKFIKNIIFTFLIILPSLSLAKNNFEKNKDYSVLPASVSSPLNASHKISVVEFFSYGCPACNRLEPELEKWLKSKPKNVEFNRIPVIFEPGWDTYAKTYYILTSLHKNAVLDSKIFAAIHQKGLDLSSSSAMKNFLVQQGMDSKFLDSAFDQSPSINLSVKNGDNMMKTYQVIEIPTFIINDTYKTSASMTQGDDKRLIAVVNYLIKISK